MKNNDFDFIKNEIEQDNIIAPDSLSAQNIAKMIEDKSPAKKPLVSRPFFRAVAMAACIAIVFALTKLPYKRKYDGTAAKPNQSESESALPTFNSYDEIKRKLNKAVDNNSSIYKDASGDLSASQNLLLGGDIVTDSYSKTYTQVEGVDEGDRVKTDGEYIYSLNSYNRQVYINKPKGEKTELVSVIDLPKTKKKILRMYEDCYLYDDLLVVNGYTERYISDRGRVAIKAVSLIYDVSNKAEPKFLKHFAQDGYLSSSRMINGVLYNISHSAAYLHTTYEYNELEDFVPRFYEGKKSEFIAPENIFYTKIGSYPQYIVMSAIDVGKQRRIGETKAVMGYYPEIYCNYENLYLAYSNYSKTDKYPSTDIVKVELASLNVVAKGSVDGEICNHYSMDEYKGYLRVATKVSKFVNGNIKQSNNLVVLDEDLSLAGGIFNYGKDESIKAARFMGNYAYVITYRETDPLFVMDLSDPKNPKLLGEAKITGFSTVLHQVDENSILGIGYETHMEDGREIEDGLKIVLFDISDKLNPKVKDSIVFNKTDSEAQMQYKALTVNNQHDYFAIPFIQYKTIYDRETGAIVFDIKDGKINIKEKVIVDKTSEMKVEFGDEVVRCAYIGDYLYPVNYKGQIFSHKVK